jgi:3-hydroxyisobutyrate dehydrogenase-like beta-hydroxyacid dehydrogenase
MAGQPIGFIGTGRTEAPMAGRLLDAGHAFCVFGANTETTKRLAARGATLVKSPAEVASTAETILLRLPAPAFPYSACIPPATTAASIDT